MDVVGDCIYDGELLLIAYILNVGDYIYMSSGGELLSIAYILDVGDGVVICLCEHMHL
jgi:hypothetical protein